MNRNIPILALLILTAHLTGCYVYIPENNQRRHKMYREQGAHEMSIGGGLESDTNLMSDLIYTSKDLHHQSDYNTGSLVGSYRYYLSHQVALGVAVGLQDFRYNWTNDQVSSSLPMYTQTTSLRTASIELKDLFNSTKYLQVYSLFGVGCAYHSDVFTPTKYNPFIYQPAPASKSYTAFDFQYSIGFQAGRTLCWFGEIGVGYRGLLNTGLSYKIPSKHPHTRTNAQKYF